MSKDLRMVRPSGVRFPGIARNVSGSRGFALVLVLSFLVLLTVVVIAYLLSATNQNSIAHNVQNTSEGKRLSDVAVQIVMGQIRQATTGGAAIAWASQPGMIRTYGTGSVSAGTAAASSQPLAYYKLYSSDNMVVTQGFSTFSPLSDVPTSPAAWWNEPSLFTDLNAPSLAASGTLEYPIIDPTAAELPGASPNNGWVAASSLSTSLVEGCSISAANTGTGTAPINYSGTPSATNNPAPMPVKWLYILRDGTVTAPTGVDSTGQVANWTSATDPTKVPSIKNPIVARIAFWTDDETCKLNLNTAAGNNYWDSPMFEDGLELEFSRYQPATHEYTRYPGHASTTSLLPVLWSYGGLSSPDSFLFPNYAPSQDAESPARLGVNGGNPSQFPASIIDPVLSANASAYLQDLMNLNPRTAWGGSSGGSATTLIAGSNQLATSALGAQRLYSSVDEMLFSPPRVSRATASANQFTFTNSDINKLRFFLTTTSRAPEVNMFNLPKVSMWPVNDPTVSNPANPQSGGVSYQSPLDQLMKFCATVGGNGYYFTRNDPTDPNNDLGGSGAGSGTGAGSSTRNVALYNYLNTLLNQSVPGFGSSFASRYGTLGSEQILTECFDYIRGTINLVDATGPSSNPFQYAFTTPPASTSSNVVAGTGQVVPINYTDPVTGNITKGLGRFPTIKQAAIMFIARAANQPPLNVDSSGNVLVGSGNSVTANPMHPWVGVMPTSGLTRTGSAGTYAIAGMPVNTMYPTISGQTHAGLRFLTTMNPSTGNFDTPNPRYSSILPTLNPYQTQMEAIFLLDLVNVAPGFVPLGLNYTVTVTGLDTLKCDGNSMNFPHFATGTFVALPGVIGDGPAYTIGKNIQTIARSCDGSAQNGALIFYSGTSSGPTPFKDTLANDATGATFQFSGGTAAGGAITVEFTSASGQQIQTIKLNFPNTAFPTPLLPIQPPQISPSYYFQNTGTPNFPPSTVFDLTPSWMLTFDSSASNPLSQSPNSGVTGMTPSSYPSGWSRLNMMTSAHSYQPGPQNFFFMPQWPSVLGTDTTGNYKLTADTIRSVECAYGDARVIASLYNVPAVFFVPHKSYFDTSMRSAHSFRGDGPIARTSYDSFCPGSTAGYLSNAHTITPGLNYDSAGANFGLPSTATTAIKNLPLAIPVPGIGSASVFPQVASSTDFDDTTATTWNSLFNNTANNPTPNNSALTKDFTTVWAKGGDYDNGPNLQADGPYINKPDEGFTNGGLATFPDFLEQTFTANGSSLFPPNRQVPSSVMFGSLPVFMDVNVTKMPNVGTHNSITPNTTGIYFWRTLLFSPNPNSQTHPSTLTQVPNSSNNYSYTPNPPDFAFLDFFNMPVVEPYAISEPFSTAGRVNMNYQIAPFTYIKRDTALRGVLRSTFVTAVPDNWMQYYKSAQQYGGVPTFGDGGNSYDQAAAGSGYFNFRYPINPTQTLQQFDTRFNGTSGVGGDIFHSPSEICSIWLYPGTQPSATFSSPPVAPAGGQTSTPLITDTAGSTTNIQNWWYGNAGIDSPHANLTNSRKSLTGDNMRERPYATIYPQLTTKSNSYTIHYRVQVLKKVPTTPANEWIENQDQIYSEYRGSSLVERYIDPNNPNLTPANDFATAFAANPATATSMDSYYNYRVLSVRKFSP